FHTRRRGGLALSLIAPALRRRESVHMNLTSGAQVFQPCSQKLVHLFLSEDFLDLGRDFGQRNVRGTAVVELGQKLLVVVALNALGIHSHCRAKPGIHYSCEIKLCSDPALQALLCHAVSLEQRVPFLLTRLSGILLL